MSPNAAARLERPLVAVLNTGSGSCDEGSAGRMAEIFAKAGLAHAELVSVGPQDIEQALRAAARKAEVVVVLGGDGTLRAAAEKCGKAGKLLIPLPGGTMNMLPHALYGMAGWEAALAATLADPVEKNISGGSADGQLFFCAAIIGAPSLWADAREAVRRGDFAEAVNRSAVAFRRRAETLDYRFGDKLAGTAEAVAVLCPLISNALGNDERALEAAALDHNTAAGMFRLAFNAIFSGWRQDPSVSLARVKTIQISSKGRTPVILDGEKARMGKRVTISFVPLAFRALVPATPAP